MKMILLFIFSLLISANAQPSLQSLSEWNLLLQQPDEWFAGAEAIRIADNVLLYQKNIGGWPKNVNMAQILNEREKNKLVAAKRKASEATIDNGATYSQMQYLARVYQATGEQRFKKAFLSGLDYLLEAQYPNGGWPQFYPVRKGYYEHITFNDDAMISVMKLFRDIIKQKPHFKFIDKPARDKVQQAYEKGMDVILRCQVQVDGELTVWCAQHEKVTLQPAKARSYELVSLSGSESVSILKFLMEINEPSPEVKTAIIAGCQWFERSKITGQRLLKKPDADQPEGYNLVLQADSQAPPLWARFYDIATNQPIYPTRDGVPHKNFSELTAERRNNYRYLGEFATDLLAKDFPAWKKKWLSAVLSE